MDKVINDIKNIALAHDGIEKVVLFGSRARGDNTSKSDYDIAVFTRALSALERSSFKNELDKIATLKKIDVVFIQDRHTDTELYKNIITDGVIIMDKFEIKLNNYKNALSRLHEAVEESKSNASLTVRDGVIQRFEFTTELAWKTAREYLLAQEVNDINSPKRVMAEAYNNDLITDEEGWIQILHDRNAASHIYDEEDIAAIYERIMSSHVKLFDELLSSLTKG